jgi:hypothetical protein
MDRLLDESNYAEVARILNENGFKTGDGLTLTSPTVGCIRTAYGLKSRFDRLRERGMLIVFDIRNSAQVSFRIPTVGTYWMSVLWLATHFHWLSTLTQVSVKRARLVYGLPL